MERTLIILKPDAVRRGILGDIVGRFERVGLKIVGIKMMQPGQEHYHHHYEDIGNMVSRRGQQAFDKTLELMLDSPVVVMVLEGIESVSLVRKMVGSTDPKSANPGTIRGDYAHMSFQHADTEGISIPNLIHASGDLEEAKKEISHWFKPDEIFEYETLYERYTQARNPNK